MFLFLMLPVGFAVHFPGNLSFSNSTLSLARLTWKTYLQHVLFLVYSGIKFSTEVSLETPWYSRWMFSVPSFIIAKWLSPQNCSFSSYLLCLRSTAGAVTHQKNFLQNGPVFGYQATASFETKHLLLTSYLFMCVSLYFSFIFTFHSSGFGIISHNLVMISSTY